MTEPKAPEKKRRPNRPLNEVQKAEAIALWRSGSVSLSDLEERFKKDRTTFLRLFEKAGVEKGEAAEETAKKVKEKVEESLVTDASVIASRIRETREDGYKMAMGIRKLVWNTLLKARQENRPFATVANDLRALNSAAITLKVIREECFVILGVDAKDANEDKPLPDLLIQELTAEDIKRMNEEQAKATQDELGLNDLPSDIGDEGIGEDDRVETDD